VILDDEDNVDPNGMTHKAWVCPDCTFINESDVITCDICGSMAFINALGKSSEI
jgi:hypothetical protein